MTQGLGLVAVVKTILGTPAFLTKCLIQSWLCAPFQLPASVHPGRQVMVQVAGSLPHTPETRTEFLAPDFGLAQFQQLRHAGSEATCGTSPCLSNMI